VTLQKSVLLVDDEPELLLINSQFLKRAGFLVSLAESGACAIKLLTDSTFDAIVCDLSMHPGMNGFDVFKYVTQNIKVRPYFIFLTGHGEGSEEMNKALLCGADAVFSKPLRSKVLIDALRGGLKVT
jgi:CheY-like chemotaxis protein